jgi:Mn-dependent DtxR family transcriptional regulator
MGEGLKMLVAQPVSPVVRDKDWHLIRKIDEGLEVGYLYEVTDDWQPKDAIGDLKCNPQSRGPAGVDWDEEPLGDVPDAEIAEKLEVSRSAVMKARKKRGIKGTRAPRKPKKINWKKQPLGEKFDAEIARDLGVDATTVRRAREKLGIPRKYIDWDKQPLGKVPDAELARELGVDASTVGKARRVRKIKAKRPYKKIDWSREPLGKISDSDIARALGVSQPRVTRARRALGIAPFKG